MNRYIAIIIAFGFTLSVGIMSPVFGAYAPERPLLIVGDQHYAPFEYLGPDGKPRGILVDYWNEWSQETGIPITYRLFAWEEALRMLETGEADALSAIFKSSDRQRFLDFGQPFYNVDGCIFFHETILGVRSLEDLHGFQVGVVRGDYAPELLNRKAPTLTLKVFENYEALVRAALENEIRIIVGDLPVISFFLAQSSAGGAFRRVPEPLYTESLHPGVRKGDEATLALFRLHAGAIPRERMQKIVQHWTGESLASRLPWVWIVGIGGLLGFCALILVFRNFRLLRRIGWASVSLARSEERYQLAVRGSNDGIWDWDRETDLVYFSPRWKSILGYEDHELPNQIDEWKSRIHPDDFDRVMEANQSLFDQSADYFEVEYRLRHKDGSWCWVFGRGTCLRDDRGRVRRTAGVHSDITQRRKVEEDLRRSEETLREILDNMMDGFYRADADGRVVMANPRMLEMLGHGRTDDMIGRDISSEFYYYPEQRKRFLDQLIADGSVTSFGVTLKSRDGSPVEVETNSRMITDPQTGSFIGVEGVVRDVAERRRHEQELQRLIAKLEAKNDELERFTYTVSHDLKSPIITIKGFLGLLERDLERADKQRITSDLERINSATDKMEQLLRELLELSRIGRMDNPLVLVSLEEVAREAMELTQGAFEKSGGTLEGLEHLPVLLCDRPRMVQVFLNLFTNAAKFYQPGVPLLVRISVSDQNDSVLIRVEDNGRGIKRDYLETIFGLFQQLDNKDEGSGLGLALVRRIIENHGGRIWAESEGVNLGTAFVIILPKAGYKTAY